MLDQIKKQCLKSTGQEMKLKERESEKKCKHTDKHNFCTSKG